MSTPIFGITIRPSSITGSLALLSAGGAIGCDAWRGSVVVVVVLVVVVVVLVEVVEVDVDVVVEVVVLVVDVVGGSVVVLVLLVVVGATVVAMVVVTAAWAVPSSSVPAQAVSRSISAASVAVTTGARRAHVNEEPPFPRTNIGHIMSNNHRPSRSIA
jgi:hypothetical protein